MNYSEKLQLILQLTDLTQEKLAHTLGVSFPTANSWIKGKSSPRPTNQKQINTLYSKVTGQKQAPDTAITAKKTLIKNKQKQHKNIIKLITGRDDLLKQFMLSLTYNTNRIEGSTLTEPETAAILFDKATLGSKTLIEQMEVKNHQAALNHLLQHLLENGKIDERLILKLHSILLNGIQLDAGCYRTHPVRIVGANIPTVNHLKIRQLMKELIPAISKSNKDTISHCAIIHSRFEQIHPFSDGNGRIGRLLSTAMLLKKNLPPAIILQKKKPQYLKSLQESQIKENHDNLEDFFIDAVLEGYMLIDNCRK
jgi:Fic family protein